MSTYLISKIVEARNIREALCLEKKGKAEIVEIFKDKVSELLLKSDEKVANSIIGFNQHN